MTDYSNQNITGQDLSGVNLTGANFTNTNATNVNFTNATITNAIFKNTLITGANISTLVFSDVQKGHLLLRAANQTIAAVNNLTSLTPAQFRIIQPAITADTITMIQTVTVKIPNSQGEGYTTSITPLINQLICIFVATNQNIILTSSGTNVRTIRSNGTVVQDVNNANSTLNYLKIGNIPYRLSVGNGDGVIAMIPIDLNVYQVNGSGLGDIVSLNLGSGATGPTGPVGAQGVAGTAGVAGSTGPTGPVGAQGVAGSAGAAGVAGSTGPTGPLGLVGPTGPAGSGGGGGGTTGPTGPAPNFSTTLEDRNLPNGSFNGFLTNAYFTNSQSWDFTNYDYVVLFEYRQTASLGDTHIRYSWFDDVSAQRYCYLSMDNIDGTQSSQETNEPILLFLNGITSATGPMDIQHYVKITFSRPKFSTNTITGQVEQFSSARDSNGFPNRAFKSVASIAYSSASVTTGILSSRLVFYNDASGGAVANQGYCKIMRKPRAESGGEFQSLGSTGPTGPVGAQGVAGAAGAAGVAGSTGPTGPQGSSVIFDGSYSSIGSFAGYTNNQFTFPNLTWDFTNYNYDIEFTLTQNNAFGNHILWNWDNLDTGRYIQSYQDKDMTTNTLYTANQMGSNLFYLQGHSDINFHFKGTLRANRPVVNIPHMMILEGQTTYVRISNNATNYSATSSSIGYSRTTNTLLFTSISTIPTNPFDGVHNFSLWSSNSNYPSFNPNIRMRVVRVPKV